MSKFLWVVSKNNLPETTKEKLKAICNELVPDNIVASNPLIHYSSHVAFGISNPKNNFSKEQNSLFVGAFIGESPEWYKPSTAFPDGSFALFREDHNFAEIVTDPAASRTIWYFFDNERLVASTSQLAIIRYLDTFEFNQDAVPWMLSSGTLGPESSWDKRLNRIPPDSSILLDKKSWTLKPKNCLIEFKEKHETDEFYAVKLKKELDNIFESLSLDFDNWILPLSGGYDSRMLLFQLTKKNAKKPKTITWGIHSSLEDPKSDAFIAKQLSKSVNVNHEFLSTNLFEGEIDILINRFVKLGEGRIDAISGYLDGFKIWKDLQESGVQGILRGDVGWTSDRHIYSISTTRSAVGLLLMKDFPNLQEIFGTNYCNQTIPSGIDRLPGEEFDLWRDRLYHNFRIPTILAALSDLKLGYVEQFNPLLSRKILNFIREQPMHLRKDKFLFKKIVKETFPDIPFAGHSAVESVADFINRKETSNYLKTNIKQRVQNDVFPLAVMEKLLTKMEHTNAKTKKSNKKPSFKTQLYSYPIIKKLKLLLKSRLKKDEKYLEKDMDFNLILYRVLIIIKSYEIFSNSDKKS